MLCTATAYRTRLALKVVFLLRVRHGSRKKPSVIRAQDDRSILVGSSQALPMDAGEDMTKYPLGTQSTDPDLMLERLLVYYSLPLISCCQEEA